MLWGLRVYLYTRRSVPKEVEAQESSRATSSADFAEYSLIFSVIITFTTLVEDS